MSGKEKDEKNSEGSGATIKVGPRLLDLLSKLGEITLEDVEINAEELEIWIPTVVPAPMPVQPAAPAAAVAPPKAVPEKPVEILKAEYKPLTQKYPGGIVEVKLGATRSEGGSRGKVVKIGGEAIPSFYLFEGVLPNPPAISVDVFDMEISLPRALKMHVQEVIGDPAAWARLAVDKFGADMITVHLISTDPLIKNTPPNKAAKTIEDVLQAVDIPVIVGGCGDPKKDAEVFRRIAEAAHGERVMLSSVTLDMVEAGVLDDVAKAAREHGHVVLAFTAMDLNRAKELNRRLYEFLPRDSIVMDLTTAALGYGIEYSFSIHERARLLALGGDVELQHPTSSGSTNAWAAREAWMKIGPEWEPRELRGPLWETITTLTLMLAGVDMFMMMHPAAIHTVKEVVQSLLSQGRANSREIADWITVKV
ncbi:CO dehydrogenase/acetyl-CoA synthase subunit delta [Candidatus Bathyarchaeota archaeon]|nr:CO dehydrogenase/acetyl-CoA synthase subunit delta [Candidatus Bathyarchaeota archaeon]